ncbi:MAG: ATP-binding protein, partial [Thermocrispum sp.]
AARRRIQLQPLEETGYRALMELQADLGDRAGAISTYHHCASTLERELGVQPDAATSRLLDHLIGAPARPLAPSEARGPARRSGVAAADLVGRAAELASLERIFGEAAAGQLGVVLVSGDAGVGKSRLVAEAALRVQRQGAVVATAQSFGASGRLALAPVADWLRHSAFRSAVPTLEPVWRSEVERLVPTAGGRESDTPSRAMVDAWQRHRFFEGLARALLSVQRPAMLILENLQWCDQETLDFLAFLLGNSPEAALMVAVTGRSDEVSQSGEYVDWLGRLRGSGRLTEIPLAPFGVDETAHLAGLLSPGLPQEQVPGLLHAATGGFPLFIVEAVRGANDVHRPVELATDDLTSVLRNRIEQTGPTAKEVAGLAAAFGQDFGLDLLAEASDLDPDTVVRAVDELWRRRIVGEVKDGYDFSHDLLRDAAYLSVSPPRRWLLHRRLAQGLELLHAGHTDAVAPQLADQYARGGQPERAVGYYRRAAEVAAGVFAHAEAIKHHRAALALLESVPAGSHRDTLELDVLQSMSAPLNARYGYAAAELQEVLERTVDLAERLGRKEALVTGLVGLWASRFVQGRTAQGHELVSRVLSESDQDNSTLSGQAHFSFAGSALHLGMP